jgi:hypothetical protein
MADYNTLRAKNQVRRTLSGKDDRPTFYQKFDQHQKTEQEKDFEAFLMILNAANRTPEKAPVHYDSFLRDGWEYFEAHPEILNARPMKLSASISEAKQRLQDTLSQKKRKEVKNNE